MAAAVANGLKDLALPRKGLATALPKHCSNLGMVHQFTGVKLVAKSRAANRAPRTPGCRAAMEYFRDSPSEEFDEKAIEYVDASVVQAREVKCNAEGFAIRMENGNLLHCTHNHPEGTRLPDYAAQPAIVLKLEDGSDIYLPIIVLELPSQMVLEALRNAPLARPTVYLVLRDLIDIMNYELKMVRITHRVCEAYYARLYLQKAGDVNAEMISMDLRPSDAINLAVRAKVPVQVNKDLAVRDGVKVVATTAKPSKPSRYVRSKAIVMTEEDVPDEADLMLRKLTSEFSLLKSMVQAAVEERYTDAAQIRNDLATLQRAAYSSDSEGEESEEESSSDI